MLFQPILPVPLYGNGANKWNFITRPTIPVLFSEPVPTGFNTFDSQRGAGGHPVADRDRAADREVDPRRGARLPVPDRHRRCFRSPPVGSRSGRGRGLPDREGGLRGVGQYYFGIGWRGDREPGVPDASYMNLLYFAYVNLPDAWQFGFSPTITYDPRASSGNKWNVPVGLMVAKTTRVGNRPVKFKFGVEYSVVSQDAYGEQAKLVLEVIPVIPALIRRSILGGN